LSWKGWYFLLALSTLFLVFAFSIFQYEPPISFGRPPYSPGFLDLISVRCRVRVIVEYSIGYLEGNQFRSASGVAVTLVDRLYTSPSGEATFFVPPGFHLLSVEDPLGLMRPWSSVISVQRHMTVRVRFDSERVRFEKIFVNADLIQDASMLKLQFKVPMANVTYVGGPFIVCWSSEGRLGIVGEELHFLYREVKPGIRDVYVMELSGIAILYVFPESSYMPLGLIFITIEEE